MAVAAALVVSGLAFSGALNNSAAAADFTVMSPSDSDYPQHVDFVTTCTVVKNAVEDPVVFPGGKSPHDHTFSGNRNVTASSTPEQLVNSPGTSCGNSGDLASYWMPTLLVDGKPVMPYQHRAYYRAATWDATKLTTPPFGLRMVAGDAMATSPQSAGVAGFQCRIEGVGATVRKQSLPPDCGSDALMEASVVFPNCWDGKNLDSADHKSHMSYAKSYVCDAAHPVQIPQLTLAARFTKGETSGTITLASMNSPLTLHADFMNAWKPAALDALMKNCIWAERFCETVTDTRMPPGMTTTDPAGSIPPAPTGGSTSTPTTSTPTTSAPMTSAPTTSAPMTSAPMTSQPTTSAPMTSHEGHSTTATAPAPSTTSATTATVTPTPSLRLSQPTATKITVEGTGFPATLPAKVTATLGSSTRSVLTRTGADGRFSADLAIPTSWTGSVKVSATADSGRVYARATMTVR
jgi:hypothetical protein